MNDLKTGKYVIGFPGSNRIKLFFERNTIEGFVLVEGVNGKGLPSNFVCKAFRNNFVEHQIKKTGSDSWLKGTMGCLLSHIKAMEKAQTDQVDYAVIAEDDAVFRYFSDDIFNIIRENQYDVTYINDRINPGGERHIARNYQIIELNIRNLKGTGAEAYILSRNAIPVILDTFAKAIADGLPCGFDCLLQSMVLIQEDNARNPRGKSWQSMLHSLKNRLLKTELDIAPGKKSLWGWLKYRQTDLKVGMVSPTLVAHVDDGISLIRH